MCEAYWTRVLAAARVNMKKPGAGHSTPPVRARAFCCCAAGTCRLVSRGKQHIASQLDCYGQKHKPQRKFSFFPVPTFEQEIQRHKSKRVCLV